MSHQITYFAGLNTTPIAEATEGQNVLISFADVKRKPGVWEREIRPRLESGAYGRVMLDSGAFTEYTEARRGRSFRIELAEYIAFALENRELFDVVIELDDIGGDLEKTRANREALEAAGLEIMPVYHQGEPLEVLDDLAERYELVGIGCQRPRRGVQAFFSEVVERVAGRCKLHALGTTNTYDLGFFSADSTTWIAEYRALRKPSTGERVDRTHGTGGLFGHFLEGLGNVEIMRLVLASYAELADDEYAWMPRWGEDRRGQGRTVTERLGWERLCAVLFALDPERFWHARRAAEDLGDFVGQTAEAWAADRGLEPEPAPCDAWHTGETCLGCDEPEWIAVLEYWPEERAFQLSACCEVSYELWVEDMNGWTRKAWAAFFLEAGIDLRDVLGGTMRPDGRGEGNPGQLTMDFGLEVVEVSREEAKAFVREHHRHNPPPAGWRWGHGLRNGRDLVAVAMVGRPVARRIDHTAVVEVNRLCVRTDIPAGLVWNACSMLYAAAVREAKRRGFERVITYTLESEAGTTLRAAGFEAVARTKGGTWNRKGRPRQDKAPTCRKIRWEKAAKKRRRAA